MLKVKRERCRRLHAFRLSVGTPKCASSARTSFIPHMRRNSIRGFHFAPQTTLCFCYKTYHWHTCGIHTNTDVHAAIELILLRNLKMPTHKKSRRVKKTQATSCPKGRGNLCQIFSVGDDLEEQLIQATQPEQVLELQSRQSTNCRRSPTRQNQFWWRKPQCWRLRRHRK